MSKAFRVDDKRLARVLAVVAMAGAVLAGGVMPVFADATVNTGYFEGVAIKLPTETFERSLDLKVGEARGESGGRRAESLFQQFANQALKAIGDDSVLTIRQIRNLKLKRKKYHQY